MGNVIYILHKTVGYHGCKIINKKIDVHSLEKKNKIVFDDQLLMLNVLNFSARYITCVECFT